MTLKAIETRLAKVERRLFNRTRGAHRYTDDELSGLIAVLRRIEDGEDVAPAREAWAAALFQREGLLP